MTTPQKAPLHTRRGERPYVIDAAVRQSGMSRPGHRVTITPTHGHSPFTEAAKANHARRRRAMIGRMGA